jgi:uncharacterized 2Fe-2S/4Fe-4S cluster protein (DUF4445 family)
LFHKKGFTMSSAEIVFLPDNRTVLVPVGTSLLNAARLAGVALEAPCNGAGSCGKCRVQTAGEHAVPHPDERDHLSESELEQGVRLACRTEAVDQSVVTLPGSPDRRHRILSDGVLPLFEIEPHITKTYLELPPPSLSDNCDDLRRLERGLGREVSAELPLSFLQGLPATLRAESGRVTVVLAGGRPIGIERGDTSSRSFGVAVDIGTTTVVAALMDLITGDELASASMINPQKEFGLDVLSRIQHLRSHPDALQTLGSLIRDGLDQLIGELCRDAEIQRAEIYEVTVAANATMTHLLLGVDPSGIGASPYLPAFTAGVTVQACALGLAISPFGQLYCLPAVSGYIGADIVAGLVAAEMERSEQIALLIDIGTNGEIVLGSSRGLHACSCAAGPALEGMNIGSGMRAAEGAIEQVHIDDGVSLTTIGGRPAVGICGSGIIDAVAELVKAGAVGRSGRFVRLTGKEAPLAWHSRLRTDGTGRFVLSETEAGEIAVSQKDIRQVQFAKGAILSGILSLTAQLGIGLEQIERVYIAGAFGHHVRKESLARLGVFPHQCLDKVILIGNSSKSGAIMALLSGEKRAEAERLARRVSYLELSCYPGYDRLFADSLGFPEERV